MSLALSPRMDPACGPARFPSGGTLRFPLGADHAGSLPGNHITNPCRYNKQGPGLGVIPRLPLMPSVTMGLFEQLGLVFPGLSAKVESHELSCVPIQAEPTYKMGLHLLSD